MKEIFIQANSLPDAYHLALVKMKQEGTFTECPDYNTNQLECSMTLHIERPLAEPRISRCLIGDARALQQYVLEITDGILDSMIGHGWDYTYHHRFVNQIHFILDELERNPSSRRAVISIRDNDYDSKHDSPACLQHLQFFIREGKLDLQVLFRSNDLAKAFFFNAFAFIKLQEIIADNLNIPVGTYSHRSNSMHVYEKDFAFLNGCVNRICDFKNYDSLFYNYEDDFKEQMEDEVPKIMELVRVQKEKYNIV